MTHSRPLSGAAPAAPIRRDLAASLSFQAPPARVAGNVQALLARLEGVRPAGDGKWYARCKAHEDNSPSLSIRDTGEKILIHCFAGCDAEDVLTAVGLTWSDLYPDPWDCAKLRPNDAARKYVKRALANLDPLDHERGILRLAAQWMRDGREMSLEDEARVQVALERLQAAEDGRHG